MGEYTLSISPNCVYIRIHIYIYCMLYAGHCEYIVLENYFIRREERTDLFPSSHLSMGISQFLPGT